MYIWPNNCSKKSICILWGWGGGFPSQIPRQLVADSVFRIMTHVMFHPPCIKLNSAGCSCKGLLLQAFSLGRPSKILYEPPKLFLCWMSIHYFWSKSNKSSSPFWDWLWSASPPRFLIFLPPGIIWSERTSHPWAGCFPLTVPESTLVMSVMPAESLCSVPTSLAWGALPQPIPSFTTCCSCPQQQCLHPGSVHGLLNPSWRMLRSHTPPPPQHDIQSRWAFPTESSQGILKAHAQNLMPYLGGLERFKRGGHYWFHEHSTSPKPSVPTTLVSILYE